METKANPWSSTDVLVFAPDGKHVVVAAAEGKAVHLIGLAKGEVLRTFPHAHVVFAAAFSHDGRHLVAGGYDSEKNTYFARLWDAGHRVLATSGSSGKCSFLNQTQGDRAMKQRHFRHSVAEW